MKEIVGPGRRPKSRVVRRVRAVSPGVWELATLGRKGICRAQQDIFRGAVAETNTQWAARAATRPAWIPVADRRMVPGVAKFASRFADGGRSQATAVSVCFQSDSQPVPT